jgi:formiminotetrahydrofolate cyclodeaminase
MKLTDQTVTELLAAFRSAEPTPGGGSASALSGAVGASLLAMVARLPRPQGATAEDIERLATAGGRCTALSEQLATLVDRDSDAYDLVVTAYRLPKHTDDEKRTRQGAIQAAMRAATDAPLDVMRACSAAIEQGAVIAAFGNRSASSDLLVGLELLGAGLRGARLNVDVNLGTLQDAAYAESARHETETLASSAEIGIAAARAALPAPA